MSSLRSPLAGCAMLALMASGAVAADAPGDYPPLRPPVSRYQAPYLGASGVYLRGDLGYRWNNLRGAESIGGPNDPTSNSLGSSASASFGVGIKSRWWRSDLTVDYALPVNYRATVTTADDVRATVQSTSFLLNGYLDLGTWFDMTPYVGAGAGIAQVRLSDFQSAVAPPFANADRSQWNFSYAGMAGVAYKVAANMQVDVGYRYHNVGNVSSVTGAAGTYTLKNIAAHEVRFGLRWYFDDLADIR